MWRSMTAKCLSVCAKLPSGRIFRKIYGTDHQRADPKRPFAQRRGAQGGYHLAKRPADITVGMILRATEGDLAPAECVSMDGHACTRSGVCPSHAVFAKVYSAINNVIDGVTLCDLIPEGENMPTAHTGTCM